LGYFRSSQASARFRLDMLEEREIEPAQSETFIATENAVSTVDFAGRRSS